MMNCGLPAARAPGDGWRVTRRGKWTQKAKSKNRNLRYDRDLEHFHQSCSGGLEVCETAVFLPLGFVLARLQGSFEPAPSPKPHPKSKMLAAHRNIFSVNALYSQMVCQPDHSGFFRKIVHLSLR
jgi:hypothetical protein